MRRFGPSVTVVALTLLAVHGFVHVRLGPRSRVCAATATTDAAADRWTIEGSSRYGHDDAARLDVVSHVKSRRRVPAVQRVTAARPARRLNHAFKYLYRHNVTDDDNLPTDQLEYLTKIAGYTVDEVQAMTVAFPPLLSLSVRQQLHPKLRFARETLHIDPRRDQLPPHYFGMRLERVLAPRHALLCYWRLRPCRRQLLPHMTEFMAACRTPQRFARQCQQWRLAESYNHDAARRAAAAMMTPQAVEAWDVLFGRGALAAARNDLVQSSHAWPLRHVNVTSQALLELLLSHGANVHERDHGGVTLLHWASGVGNVDSVRLLLRQSLRPTCTTTRDGATPLHWAAAGAGPRSFGTGGHVPVCRVLLNALCSRSDQLALVEAVTDDGNSALMWAAWSGSLNVVQYLVEEHGANAYIANKNGCTAAHWAASGGNLDVCRYLAEVCRVDFSVANHGGNTPLTHAVAFGRSDVVAWLGRREGQPDAAALKLAQNFVQWNATDMQRQEMLALLQGNEQRHM